MNQPLTFTTTTKEKGRGNLPKTKEKGRGNLPKVKAKTTPKETRLNAVPPGHVNHVNGIRTILATVPVDHGPSHGAHTPFSTMEELTLMTKPADVVSVCNTAVASAPG